MTRKRILPTRFQRNLSIKSSHSSLFESGILRIHRPVAHTIRRHRQSDIIPPKVSSQTMQILKHSWESICKNKPTILPEIKSLGDSDIKNIHSVSMYSYIPQKIREEFESIKQTGITCEAELSRGRKCIIHIVAPSHSNNSFESYVVDILTWLNFASSIASPQCAQTLHVYLLLTDAKKRIPTLDTEPIDQIHANTAFTTSCSPKNSIFIFRREEWFKVMMHETFHCFGLDFSSSVGDKSNERILSIFPAVNPNTDIRLYETFCEMWAELFHIMFCLFHKKCRKFSEKKYREALVKEQRFSIYQSNKVLKCAGYNYKSILVFPSSPLYTENTQAFSYYVIKSIMMWNLDQFIAWCLKYAKSKENHIPIQFNIRHINQYCNLVEQMTKNDRGYANATEKRPSREILNIADITHTLRMTSIDMD